MKLLLVLVSGLVLVACTGGYGPTNPSSANHPMRQIITDRSTIDVICDEQTGNLLYVEDHNYNAIAIVPGGCAKS